MNTENRKVYKVQVPIDYMDIMTDEELERFDSYQEKYGDLIDEAVMKVESMNEPTEIEDEDIQHEETDGE